MVVRLDDVNPNLDWDDLHEQVTILQDYFDEILLGVNLFGKESVNGAIHPCLPMKNQSTKYFYDVDRMVNMEIINTFSQMDKVEIVSHGLVHAMHSKLTKDAIEMSILTSCSFLGTKQFIPPFNEVNADVVAVCQENGIELIGNNDKYDWHSLETDTFSKDMKDWYYHPWRLNAEQLYLALDRAS